MISVIKGIESDVRFNHSAASTLASRCRTAANRIDGQAGSRATWVNHALTDFRGYYAALFRGNGSVQAADARLLAARLREVASGVEQLAREARSEQQPQRGPGVEASTGRAGFLGPRLGLVHRRRAAARRPGGTTGHVDVRPVRAGRPPAPAGVGQFGHVVGAAPRTCAPSPPTPVAPMTSCAPTRARCARPTRPSSPGAAGAR